MKPWHGNCWPIGNNVDASDIPRSEIVRHVIEYSVLAAHRHVFGVLTWYVLLAAVGLGPYGRCVLPHGRICCALLEATASKQTG